MRGLGATIFSAHELELAAMAEAGKRLGCGGRVTAGFVWLMRDDGVYGLEVTLREADAPADTEAVK